MNSESHKYYKSNSKSSKVMGKKSIFVGIMSIVVYIIEKNL